MRGWVITFWRSLSAGGLVVGTLFFVASLTPTLIPRTYLTQGVLSGACFAAGYGVGVAWRWLWAYMELPEPRERLLLALKIAVASACAVVAMMFLWRAAGWQNSIRELMQLEPVPSAHPLEVCVIAIVTFLVLIALARLFKRISRLISERLGRLVPRRVSKVVGFTVAILLFWALANGVLVRYALHVANSSFATFDALVEPDRAQPTAPSRPAVPLPSSIGRNLDGLAGNSSRRHLPASEISMFTQRKALEPIRVYVGLRAADTAEERASLPWRN